MLVQKRKYILIRRCSRSLFESAKKALGHVVIDRHKKKNCTNSELTETQYSEVEY